MDCCFVSNAWAAVAQGIAPAACAHENCSRESVHTCECDRRGGPTRHASCARAPESMEWKTWYKHGPAGQPARPACYWCSAIRFVSAPRPEVASSSRMRASASMAMRPFHVSALLVHPHFHTSTGGGRTLRSRSYVSSSAPTAPAGDREERQAGAHRNQSATGRWHGALPEKRCKKGKQQGCSSRWAVERPGEI